MTRPSAEFPPDICAVLFDGAPPAGGFYQKFDDAFCAIEFGNQARSLCEPFYCSDTSAGGRPGVDPEICFEMLFVGFFENIP